MKNPPANAGATGDMGSIPASGRSPGRGHGNPLQCLCLENPMGRGAQRATDLTVTQSWIRLKPLSTSPPTFKDYHHDHHDTEGLTAEKWDQT